MKRGLYLIILFLTLGSWCVAVQAGSLNYYQAFRDSYRYEKMGAYRDAILAILPIYQEHPRFYLVNLRLGWLYYLSGKYGNSIEHYQKALEVQPQSFEAMLGLSLPLMAQKKWNKVERLMNQLVSQDRYNFYGNLRLAIALRLQNKANLAEKVCRHMLSHYPASLPFLVELGQDLWWQGKKEEARQVLGQVLLIDPENVVARELLKK